jgi:hypothetical protein
MARLSFTPYVLIGILTLLAPLEAEGQTIPSPYRFLETRQEAGAFAGVSGQATGRFGYGPSPGAVFGVRYGIHLGGPFGLEGTVGYSPTTRDVVDPSREEGDMVVGEADAELLNIDARLRFSLTGDRLWRGLNPLVFAGLGVTWDLAGESDQDALVLPDDKFEFGARFLAVIGGGIRWFPSDRILVRGDMTINMYQLKTPRGFLDPARGLTGVGEKEWVSGPTFTIGAAFNF